MSAVWDSVSTNDNSKGSSSLDLADFAAAALRFRSETMDMVRHDSTSLQGKADILDSLIDDTINVDTDDVELPEWADENPSETDQTEKVECAGKNQIQESQDLPSTFNFSDSLSQVEDVSSGMWSYLDPQNNVQGPFHTSEMRQWHDAGYFKFDLPIKLSNWLHFHPLGLVYPNQATAFETDLVLEPGMIPSSESRPVMSQIYIPNIVEVQQQQQQQQQKQQQLQQQQIEAQRIQQQQQILEQVLIYAIQSYIST